MSAGTTVFISYAREDAPFARRLYADLKSVGVEPWLDLEELLPGQNWKREIENAIRSSDYFLALLSSRAVSKRGYVQSEVKLALDALDEVPETNVYLIPARIDDCKPAHKRIEEIHWVDLSPSYENGLIKILRVIRPEAVINNESLGSLAIEDDEDLADAGWGVIFAAGVDSTVREALGPLLELRRNQASRKHGRFFKEFMGDLGYQQGDSAYDFLGRHGAGPGPVDPNRVPSYLLIVGDPESIPFSFQQQLSVQYRVGRISFAAPQDYSNYARSVLRAEATRFKEDKRAVFFGVKNNDDKAMELATNQLVQPLAQAQALSLPNWERVVVAGEECSKNRLRELLGGSDTPRLLFIVAQGMIFRSEDERQVSQQGAIVCQEWPGPTWRGRIPESFYFSSKDLAEDSDLTGTIIFYFGSYGAGTSREIGSSPGVGSAQQAFVSALAQRLLSQPAGGALAVIAQADLGLLWSFLWRSAGPQTQTFEYALRSLMKGQPAGLAVQHFSRRHAEIAAEWSRLAQVRHKDDEHLNYLRAAAADSKSYIVIGDPAVRIS